MATDFSKLNVKDAAEPPASTRTRNRKPNPFVEPLTLSYNEESWKVARVNDDEKTVRDAQNLIRRASNELEIGASIRVDYDGAPDGKADVYFLGKERRGYTA